MNMRKEPYQKKNTRAQKLLRKLKCMTDEERVQKRAESIHLFEFRIKDLLCNYKKILKSILKPTIKCINQCTLLFLKNTECLNWW